MHPSFCRNYPKEAGPWQKESHSSAWCLWLLTCPFPAFSREAFNESCCSKQAELFCPTPPLKRFWMKWEKRMKKCFPTPPSLWTQGQSAHPKFAFHLGIFRVRQTSQNQKAVQTLYLIFIKICIFRLGDQFYDILLTGSWKFFSVVSWGSKAFLLHSQSPISHLGMNWLISKLTCT